MVMSPDLQEEISESVTVVLQQQQSGPVGFGESIELVAAQPYTGSTTNVHPWLSSMVNYAQPIKFPGFDDAERKRNFLGIIMIIYGASYYLFEHFLNLCFLNTVFDLRK